LLDAFYFDHPELAPKGTTRNMASYVYRNALKHQLIEAKATPQVEAYYDQLDRQVDQAAAWRFVSPALMLQAALDRMAGHATTDYLTFQREVDAARGAWRDFFQPKIFKDEAITRRDLQAMPTWQVQAPAPAADRWWDLLGLLGFVAGLAALAWRARASGIDPRGLG
jgi:ABC-2 type transport system permease protein